MRGHEMILDAGGNVSVTLFRFLQWCGVSGILLVGQDFAWKGEHTHAEGHHAHDRKLPENKKKNATLKDVNGETLQSSMPYIAALRDMERDIAKAQFPVYQLYGGGAMIKGAEHIQENDVHQLVDSDPDRVAFFLNAIDRARPPPESARIRTQSPAMDCAAADRAKAIGKTFQKAGQKPPGNLEDLQKSSRIPAPGAAVSALPVSMRS